MAVVKMEAYVDRNNIPHTKYPTLWWGEYGTTINEQNEVVWLEQQWEYEYEEIENAWGENKKILFSKKCSIREIPIEEVKYEYKRRQTL